MEAPGSDPDDAADAAVDGTAAFDVVALVAPSGGVEVLASVLRSLPGDFPAPIVVLQHLSDQGRGLASVLRRRIGLPVGWASEGDELGPGRVILCPPTSGLVVLPDGTFSILSAVLPQDRPADILLESLAECAGRTLAVILAGGGRDGAAGARAVRAAGGMVVSQGDEASDGDPSADRPAALPTAAAAAGAVDLVVPLEGIGALLAEVMYHGIRPPESPDEAALQRVFVGDGEAATLLRAVDWPATPLGPVGAWPASLAAAVRTMLDNPLPVAVHWGPDLVVLANDASRRLYGGADFARVVGRPLRDAWPEEWGLTGPAHLEVLETGRARVVENVPHTVGREAGRREDIFLTTALIALRGDRGSLAGTLSTAVDTTDHVVGIRQVDLLRRLQVEGTGAPTVAEACARVVGALAADPGLVPFALVYLLDGPRTRAQLRASTGLDVGSAAAPRTISLRPEGRVSGDRGSDDWASDDWASGDPVWPIDAVARLGSPVLVADLADRLPPRTGDPGAEPAVAALVLPLRLAGDERVVGAVVLGLSPRRSLDTSYRGLLDRVAAQLEAAMGDARTFEHEKARLEAMADVDRAKTEFFANVSHEFRTPLTLLLGPLDAALADRQALPDGVAGHLDVAHRSALRMLRMVGSLLDFSQIEAGRKRGTFEATDLSSLTRDLVGVFRSAAEDAGLQLVLDCPPLPEPVWVDRVMWERIVSNLVSNSLKFTLRGQITVTLRLLPSHAELVVADTGSGIPDAEVAHVFQRFHRVQPVPARTTEGTGIGLALVHDLVRLHHGRIRVKSRLGEGSTFTVWVPRGRRPDATGTAPGPGAANDPGPLAVARSHADEARAWMSTSLAATSLTTPVEGPVPALAPWGRVLVVDDNADMRAYLGRLLGRHWKVDLAAGASEARARIAAGAPDLVLADVMMADVDGLTLVRELRLHPRARDVPLVLLSARAGEDAVIAGLEAGADDYIVKPFSSRELVARIGAQMELSRLRRQRDHAVRTGDDRLRFALEAAGHVAFEWDTDTNQVVFLGGDGRSLYGITSPDIATLVDLVHEDDLALHMASLHRTLTTGRAYVNEYRIRLPDGAVRWIRSVAHRMPGDDRRLFGVSLDVTERRRDDDRLRQASAQWSADDPED